MLSNVFWCAKEKSNDDAALSCASHSTVTQLSWANTLNSPQLFDNRQGKGAELTSSVLSLHQSAQTCSGEIVADDERQKKVRGLLVENQDFLRAIAIVRCNGTWIDADDIVQLTNKRVLECWFQWRGVAFKIWLREIMISQFKKEMRRERLRRGVDLNDDAWARIEDDNPSGGADAVVAGLDFNKTLSYLSPDHQEILLLRMEGLSYEQLAEALGITKGTVMSRLKRARDSFEQHRLDLDQGRQGGGS